MPLPAIDPHGMASWLPFVGDSVRSAVRWGSEHTGLPVILVAAITMVVSFRMFKRSVRFAVEVVVCVALLAFATKLGWIHW
jgi:hypothetical protein